MLTMPDPNDQNTLKEAILRSELKSLTEETVAMNKFRDYFEGEQSLVYSTEIFQQVFGNSFKGFKDNWMEVIVNATRDRLKVIGFNFDDDDNFTLSDRLWEIFEANEFDEQQDDLHEGILVEGRAFVIVWPDDELGATIDWQPGQLCRIFYDPERRTRRLWAVKRWTTDFGDVYVTFYTPEAVYKFIDKSGISGTSTRTSTDTPRPGSSALTEIPGVGWFGNLEKRKVGDEEWPLPNPLGVVPVVEFNNTSYRSEIKHHVPQQDALNKTLLDLMVAGEFAASPQRAVETMAKAPDGGWKSSPGEVWQFPPAFDADGRHIATQFHSFDAMDPSNFIRPTEMWLQHMALTSHTPVRYFMQADRGGRGDAPSGDSLLVDDKPLNDKVETKQVRFGNRHMEVARLVARAAKITDERIKGETQWQDPRHDYRVAKIAEGQALIDMGIPLEYATRVIGLPPDDLKEVLDMIAEAKAEKEKKEQEMLVQQEANQQAKQQVKQPVAKPNPS